MWSYAVLVVHAKNNDDDLTTDWCTDVFQLMQSNMKMADAMATTTKVGYSVCVYYNLW